MILDYYRIFYYVAQYKSFSKAAEVMGNNQPNITRCMNILEMSWAANCSPLQQRCQLHSRRRTPS